MALNTPTSDFQTSSLNGAINASVDSMTIGTGLSIPATNGALQIDYDSIIAVGSASSPETILYATYNSVTGAVSGMTRGQAGTTGVSHSNGASIQCGNSSVYFTALNALYDGWIPVEETWSRVSNTSFTITGDYTGVLAVGDKLKVTDTTVKYFYITAVSYSAPNTTVTITGGTDYVLAATPTLQYYSKASSPVGFPDWFNWTPTLGASGSMTFTSTNILNARFKITGRQVTVSITTTGTTGGSASVNLTFTLPIVGARQYNGFSAYVGDGGDIVGFGFLDSNKNKVFIEKTGGDNFGLGAGRSFSCYGSYEI